VTAIGEGVGHLLVNFGKLMTIFSQKDVVNAINIAFSVLDGTLIAIIRTVEFLKSAWDKIVPTARRDTHEVAQSFDALRHDLADWAHNIASYFDESRANVARWAQDVQRWADSVVRWFQALPGKILHALGNMSTLLVQAGKDVVEGFIRGIESMFGAIAAAAGHMVSSLGSGVLHLLGIGSPSKVAHWWGQMVSQGMAEGIDSGAARVAASAARLAGGVSAGLGSGGRYGAAGPAGLQLVITHSGGGTGLDNMFWTWFKNGIRAQGGDPRIVSRKVAFQ